MKIKIFLFIICCALFTSVAFAQPDRWQQRVKYTMIVNMDVNTNQFTGKQKLEYSNNSPDTLKRVFFHLYWNAFQPNSMMDVRSRRQGTIVLGKDKNGNDVLDWDSRVKDRIAKLKPDEMGYLHVKFVKTNGVEQVIKEHETILEVDLAKPILPESKVVFETEFEAQVPIQIRRSGRDNLQTKVRYSMSQWYPKICEYDREGWHPTPYVGREFYGVWGDFDVSINIDKKYILGGTGYLQNPQSIGYGYETPRTKVSLPPGNTLTWHFIAPNVHDFMWAADPDFIHKSKKIRDDLTFNVLYKPTNAEAKDWDKILDDAARALPYIEKTFGQYPYKQYSFIHGGDGGMEYPMATLLSSPRAWLHEFLHSWYQGMMGTNESEYAWMDEGFTNYASSRVQAYLNSSKDFAQAGNYNGYYSIVRSGVEEPMTTHADHFNTNLAYSRASYSKGAVFLEQLGYIVSDSVRDAILMEYYREWRFKHPDANDFIRVAEKVSGMKLDWYKEYWINTTKTINYSIDSLWEENGVSKIRVRNLDQMPMPIDLVLTFKDGSEEMHYIPMYLMFGEKPQEDTTMKRFVYPAWKWTHPTYVIESKRRLTDLSLVEIDPSLRMADIDRRNNRLELKW